MPDPSPTLIEWATRAKEIAVLLNPHLVKEEITAVSFHMAVVYDQVDGPAIEVVYTKWGAPDDSASVYVTYWHLTMTDAEILAEAAEDKVAQRKMLLNDIAGWEQQVEEAGTKINHARVERTEAKDALTRARAHLKKFDAANRKEK